MDLIEFLNERNIEYTVEKNNLTVGCSLYLEGTGITELPDNLTVGGSLYLEGTGITELPDNLTVGGSLYLRGTGITELPDNLTVGCSLYLEGTGITELPDNLTVGGSLYLEGTGITELPDNLTVGCSLYLEGTGITELPDNLTVGGSLYLRGTGITELPDNLTVGGSLYLRGTGITELPDNLTVGCSLYLEGTGIKQPTKRSKLPEDFKLKIKASVEFQFNKKGFTFADNILAKILNIKGDVKKVLIVGKEKPSWLITKSNVHSHGETIKEAREGLIYKLSDRDTSKYKNLKLTDEVTKGEAIQMYMAITGACSQGTKHFVNQNKNNEKPKFKISELIALTKGQYGSENFTQFFGGNNA